MEKRTKHYLQKFIIRKLFGKKYYIKVKFLKILFKVKTGSNYEITPILMNILNDDDVFFDIGANLGQYTIRIKYKFNYGVKIFAFEPVIENYKVLQSYLIKKYENVILENYAVSDSEGEGVLYIPTINDIEIDTQASIDLENRRNYYSNFAKQKIQKITIDKYVSANAIERIDYIKIDTEGNDAKVLKGALNSIRSHKPVIFSEDLSDPEVLIELENMNYTGFLLTYDYCLIDLNTTNLTKTFDDLTIFIPEGKLRIFNKYMIKNLI